MDIRDNTNELIYIMVDYFYKTTNYENIKMNIEICDKLFDRIKSLYPNSKNKIPILFSGVDSLNGIAFPSDNLDDGYNVLISRDKLYQDDYTFYGTFQHEITHAHDMAIIAKHIGAKNGRCLVESEMYNSSMGVISEFNARRNGYNIVRKIIYNFDDRQKEKKFVLNKEIPFIFDNFKITEKTWYEIAQYLGRIAAIDCIENEKVEDLFFELCENFWDYQTIRKVKNIYDILYEARNDCYNTINCHDRINRLM